MSRAVSSSQTELLPFNAPDYVSFTPYCCARFKGLGVLPEAEAPFANPGEGISNVNILRVDQNGSSLTFSVAWADGGGVGGFEDTSEFVDVWLAAYQSDPPAWVELSAGLVRYRPSSPGKLRARINRTALFCRFDRAAMAETAVAVTAVAEEAVTAAAAALRVVERHILPGRCRRALSHFRHTVVH